MWIHEINLNTLHILLQNPILFEYILDILSKVPVLDISNTHSLIMRWVDNPENLSDEDKDQIEFVFKNNLLRKVVNEKVEATKFENEFYSTKLVKPWEFTNAEKPFEFWKYAIQQNWSWKRSIKELLLDEDVRAKDWNKLAKKMEELFIKKYSFKKCMHIWDVFYLTYKEDWDIFTLWLYVNQKWDDLESRDLLNTKEIKELEYFTTSDSKNLLNHRFRTKDSSWNEEFFKFTSMVSLKKLLLIYWKQVRDQ